LTRGGARGSNYKGRVAELEPFTEEERKGGREGGNAKQVRDVVYTFQGRKEGGRREGETRTVGRPSI